MRESFKKYPVVTNYSDEDKGFIATASGFPGISAFGKTRQGAVRELEAALKAVIVEYDESGWPLPGPLMVSEVCKWKADPDGTWGEMWWESCGRGDKGFMFEEGGPIDNRFVYCPFCGRRIEEALDAHNE